MLLLPEQAAMSGLPQHRFSVHQQEEGISSKQLVSEALYPLFSCQRPDLGPCLVVPSTALLAGRVTTIETLIGATQLVM